jgi:hypothetical protein
MAVFHQACTFLWQVMEAEKTPAAGCSQRPGHTVAKLQGPPGKVDPVVAFAKRCDPTHNFMT